MSSYPALDMAAGSDCLPRRRREEDSRGCEAGSDGGAGGGGRLARDRLAERREGAAAAEASFWGEICSGLLSCALRLRLVVEGLGVE